MSEGDLQARKKARTDGSADIVNGISLPHLLLVFIEGQLGKDEGGDQGLKVWFELNPRRLGLDTRIGHWGWDMERGEKRTTR